ncbi:response regulator [Mariniblastus fucicola]|uniref:Response regulator rcp1 n=1 Tax=Mariniblastus fucicola TaxID=980251 RepID=A0A5B9PMN1_9BACT|nr:response regulator [Mariniblastus fucicola]QEG23841.1 Response regulator rcp1 [Mariniblastus fucicola]
MRDEKPIVLIVEDDEVDTEVVCRGIERRKLDCDVRDFNDASNALAYLRDLPPATAERVITLLDINMPGMNGHQFLRELRKDSLLRKNIVFVLTTSRHRRDIADAYDSNVSGYFIKAKIDLLFDVLEIFINSVELPLGSDSDVVL